jgi:acyl transferase domain-containing protein
MDPILEEFEAIARSVTYREPSIPVVSTIPPKAGSNLG